MSLSRLISKTVTMQSKRYSSDYAEFREVLKKSRKIIALTGAGISAESGIPVFRGAGGLWRKYRATNLATPEAFKRNPSLVWEFYQYRRHVAFNCQPNKAHYALVDLEKRCNDEGKSFAVITQNVDGLHRKAGSKDVVELHGCLSKVICTKCKHIEEDFNDPICESLRGRGDPNKEDEEPILIVDLPKCVKCKALVRPYIVWFGENLDEQVLDRARNLVENCDLCLIIGTSSVVYPAAMFAPLVAERGMPVAEFNLNELPADDNFAFHFPGLCGTTLPEALRI